MELHSLQSPSLSIIPTSLTGRKSFLLHGQAVNFPGFNKCQNGSKLGFTNFRTKVSGTAKFKPVKAMSKNVDSKDEDLVFVAGATGKVGSRTVRELLKLGFRVRAGVRSAQRAGPLVQSVNEMKFDTGSSGEETKPVEKLELVECDLEKPDQIEEAIENASVVICCIGASEKEISDITGPYRIDYKATENLIKAATVAKVDQFIMVSSLGTNKLGFPAAILNLFWGVLIWKRKAEEALIASGIPYTIVRPGGMERPTDAYKETHNLTLSLEDTLFGGQVSNLQVAELLAFMAKNRELSCCKVVEVIAETTAPLTPMGELLTKIPSQRVVAPRPKKVEATIKVEPAAVLTPAPIESVVPEATIKVEPETVSTPSPIESVVPETTIKVEPETVSTPSPIESVVPEATIKVEPETVSTPSPIESVVPEATIKVEPETVSTPSPIESVVPEATIKVEPETVSTPTPIESVVPEATIKVEPETVSAPSPIESVVPEATIKVEPETVSAPAPIESVVPEATIKVEPETVSTPAPIESVVPEATIKVEPETVSTPAPIESVVPEATIKVEPETVSTPAPIESVVPEATIKVEPETVSAPAPIESVVPEATIKVEPETVSTPAPIESVVPEATIKVEPETVSAPAPIESVVPEATITPNEPEPVQEKAKVARPLSPYAAYEDLKPPTSPAPALSSFAAAPETSNLSPEITMATPETSTLSPEITVATPETGNLSPEITAVGEAPSIPTEQETAPLKAISQRPLSPFAAYEDLKPPTSPLPKASGPKEIPLIASAQVEVPLIASAQVEVPLIDSAQVEVPLIDSAPLEAPLPSLEGQNGATSSIDDKENRKEATHSHSPYYAYEDLKPPTSPVPVPRKL